MQPPKRCNKHAKAVIQVIISNINAEHNHCCRFILKKNLKLFEKCFCTMFLTAGLFKYV